MGYKREYETQCDAYELNVDALTGKKKWTKRGINGNLVLYSNEDNVSDLRVRFELHNIQIWWKVFNPRLKKKGSKTRVVTFKRLSTDDQTKETIALRFKDPQICQSFVAKWESLTREIEYNSDESEAPAAAAAEGGGDDADAQPANDSAEKPKILLKEMDDEKQVLVFADKSSFRDLIRINRLPPRSLISSAHILGEYHINYGIEDKLVWQQGSDQVSYANFSYGKHDNSEHYLSLWMNSAVIQRVLGSFHARPKMNVVVCLDISESMKESLCTNELTRIEVAQAALVQLCRMSLEKTDRFAIVTFNQDSQVAYPLTLVDNVPYGMLALRQHILSFAPSGTTDLEQAYRRALGIFREDVLSDARDNGYQNRILFMTDLQLNPARTEAYNDGKQGLFGLIRAAAEQKQVYTTFMSMGVEQDPQLLRDALATVQGCDYMTLRNTKEFMAKFDKKRELRFVLAPIVTDLSVSVDTDIMEVYTDLDRNIGDVLHGQLLAVKSMFGGSHHDYSAPMIVKFKYKPQLRLTVEFTEHSGTESKRHCSQQIIDLEYKDVDDELAAYDNDGLAQLVKQKDFYDSLGIRKVVLLCRYIDWLKKWITNDTKTVVDDEDDKERRGEVHKLIISEEYQSAFGRFTQEFENEMKIIGDDTLQKELEVIQKLATYQDHIDVD